MKIDAVATTILASCIALLLAWHSNGFAIRFRSARHRGEESAKRWSAIGGIFGSQPLSMRNKAIYAIALGALAGCSKASADIAIKNTSNASVAVTYQTQQGGQERSLVVPAGGTITLPDTKGGYAALRRWNLGASARMS